MSNLKLVFQFAWTYLRRYWVRLALGVLLGVLFGLSNASFVWATGIITERISPAKEPAVSNENAGKTIVPSSTLERWKETGKEFVERLNTRVKQSLDAWLPAAGRKLDWKQIVGGLLFLPLLVAVRSGTGYLSSYCMGWVSERVINDLRFDVLSKLSTLSLHFFNRSHTGDLLTHITSDTAILQRALRSGFGDIVKESITVASIFVALCLIDWKLTLFSMVALPLCLAPLFVLGRKARRASAASVKATVSQSSQLVELVSSVRVVKAFHLEREQLARFRKSSKELVRQSMKGVKAKELVNPIIEVISTIAIGALIVYLIATQSTMKDLVSFLTGLLIFYTPVKKLAGIHIVMEQASVGVNRLMNILSEKPSVEEPIQPKPLTRFNSAITLSDVSFAYADKMVLKKLNLAIPRGFRLGIAGPSGCGKSTLVNLIFRFYDPSQGSIQIDGIDLRDISTYDLRQLMALVSQEVVLFDQTVAENIACGKSEATREQIEAAARAAFAHEFILQLPDGYETRIGERGVTLSGGQRQRLAIARAFIRDAPILVLDEATAALDADAEAEVQAAIERLAENRTVICIAHRLSTLASLDHIIVLAEGRIVEQGGFGELVQAGGTFAEMAKRQGISRDKVQGPMLQSPKSET
jgi:subfamily B ATP-binding cassette protein MsbA